MSSTLLLTKISGPVTNKKRATFDAKVAHLRCVNDRLMI